mmetsp:Transcript_7987/g.13182  ORF Transcript_7987/g.13182 Transcript_7987/m.13182 type:complete len:511 (-) Transcript_7987:246-1778(-)
MNTTSNANRRSCIGRCRRSILSMLSLSSLLILLFISIDYSAYHCKAWKIGNKKNEEESDKAPAESSTQQNEASSSTPTPTTILETEARTARELSKAVSTLTKDLKSCNSRIDSIKSGFQDLYSMHLTQIDGLRKCKEGMISSSDLQQLLDTNTNQKKFTNEDTTKALMEQAHASIIEQQRLEQNEQLATKHKELILKLEHQVHQLRLRETAWERTISELVARKDLLERRENAWTRTIGELMADIEIRNKREWWWEEMKSEMEGRIGGLSYQAVLERYGPGPHRVSMIIDLDDTQQEVLIELAPITLMPHSVHTFLSQLSEGYWTRGTPAIVMNPGHVLQACPHPCLETKAMGGSYPGDPYVDMKHAGLDTVSFQEYHPEYPHEKYTIGFAGRPHSGPEFYINMMNNTMDHGPKEAITKKAIEDEEEVDEMTMEPDPCFGKIISGFEVIDKIAEGLTRGDLPDESKETSDDDDDEEALSDSLLIQPVRIVSMSIISESDDSSTSEDTRDEL